MNTNEILLWDKLKAFQLDDAQASFQFSDRLTRENDWSAAYSKRVIEEYKKFLFLCCISENGVTPSDQVDQVWHLHLTYTRSYWIDLCRGTLSKEIHHNPTKGGSSEKKKFDGFYSETLKLYLEKFGEEAPADIWPCNEQRFSDIHFQRINIKKNWVIRKPHLRGKNTLVFLLLFLSPFLIQSRSQDGPWMFVVICTIAFILWTIFSNTGGGTGCSTGGDSGHTFDNHSGCNGHSGCSGCGSGCSGCGGD